MAEVEFRAKVKNGMIEIPTEYRQELGEGSLVRVTVQSKSQKSQRTSIMDKLAKNPISVRGLRKLTRDELHDRNL